MPEYTSILPPREIPTVGKTLDNPLVNGIQSITKVVRNNLQVGTEIVKHGRPFLQQVIAGQTFRRPKLPAVDVVFRRLEPKNRTLGNPLGTARATWDLVYELRYMHSLLEPGLKEQVACENLARIQGLLEYESDLHGFCGRLPAKVESITAGEMEFEDETEAGSLFGGTIVVRAPYRYNYPSQSGRTKTPLVLRPRSIFWEGVLNIQKVLQDSLGAAQEDVEVGRPDLKEVLAGSVRLRPSLPSVDIRFVRELSGAKGPGVKQVEMEFDLFYSLRLMHSVIDKNFNDLLVTENLFRILHVLFHNNSLNGFSPNFKFEVEGVNQGIAAFGETKAFGYVAGGAIVLRVPLRADVSVFDQGFTERSFAPPSGPTS